MTPVGWGGGGVIKAIGELLAVGLIGVKVHISNRKGL